MRSRPPERWWGTPPVKGTSTTEFTITKVDGEVDPASIPGDLLEDAEKVLSESIKARERENQRLPRGNPNGSDREREQYRVFRGHQKWIEREQEWLRDVRWRIELQKSFSR